MACRLAEWVAVVFAAQPAPPGSALGQGRYINGRSIKKSAFTSHSDA